MVVQKLRDGYTYASAHPSLATPRTQAASINGSSSSAEPPALPCFMASKLVTKYAMRDPTDADVADSLNRWKDDNPGRTGKLGGSFMRHAYGRSHHTGQYPRQFFDPDDACLIGYGMPSTLEAEARETSGIAHAKHVLKIGGNHDDVAVLSGSYTAADSGALY